MSCDKSLVRRSSMLTLVPLNAVGWSRENLPDSAIVIGKQAELSRPDSSCVDCRYNLC